MKFRPYNFRWIDQVPLSNLVRSTKNLRLYVEVSRILGPRALDGMRTDAASQLAFAAANTAAINGGQLRAGSARVRVTRVN